MSNADRIEELRTKYEENPRRYFAPLANEFRKAGDLAQAIAICREHLPKQPGHMSGYIVFGQTLYEAGSLDEARAVFEQALSLDPENLIALKHLGDIARTKGENAVARRWYERVLDADPRNDDIAAQLASLSIPTPPLAMPAIPAPMTMAAAPMQLEDASGVFRSFDPGALLDVPDDVISGDRAQSEWAPRPTSTPRPTPTHEPIDLDFPDDPEPVASAALEEEFEEGLIAPEWPDTSDLVARITTPFRAGTPINVPITPDAVAAFGREERDEMTTTTDNVIAADMELDDSFVDAYVPPARETQPVAEPEFVAHEAATPLHMMFNATPDHVDVVELPQPADEMSDTAEYAIPHFSVETSEAATESTGAVETNESESLVGESFAAVASEEAFAPAETFAEFTPDDTFVPMSNDDAFDAAVAFDMAATDEATTTESDETVVAAVSDEESFAAINPEIPVSSENSDDLFNELDDNSAFANNPIFQSAFAPMADEPTTEESVGSFMAEPVNESSFAAEPSIESSFASFDVEESFDSFTSEESFADVTADMTAEASADATMEALAETADEDDADSELLVAAATAENVQEEEAPFDIQPAAPPVAEHFSPSVSEEHSSGFVTETMAELLVSQGFVPRAIEIYEELVRRHAYDPVLSSRLAELRSQEFQQAQIEQHAEQQLGEAADSEELLPQDTAYYASDIGHVQSFATAAPTPRFATPIRNTPLYFTPLSATPLATTAVAEPAVATASAAHDDTPPYRTARERFAELARRRVSRRTPTHATAIAEDSAEGLSSLFGSALPTTPDELAARALADAFGPVQDSGESLFDMPPNSAPVAPLRSFTPRANPSIHGGMVPPTDGRTERPVNADYSFDRFFPDPAMTSNSSGAASTFPQAAASTTSPANEDLAQFSAWLKGLNNA